MNKYFITENGEQEEEVSKWEWVTFERANGFHNTLGQPDEPATSSFSGRHGSGRLVYGRGETA